jgi:predicted DNA-binding antitoxin AbrB/MazE fold protein
MTTMTLQATYRNGVLQLPHALDLPDGAKVELQITPVEPPVDQARRFGDLAGIWKHLTAGEVSQLEADLYRFRQQSAERLRQLRDRAEDANG